MVWSNTASLEKTTTNHQPQEIKKMVQVELNRATAMITFEDHEMILLQDEIILEKVNGQIFVTETFSWLIDDYDCLTVVTAQVFGDIKICAIVAGFSGTFRADLIHNGSYFVYHTVNGRKKLINQSFNNSNFNAQLSDYCTNYLELAMPFQQNKTL